MQKRKQSVTVLSFDNAQSGPRATFYREEEESQAERDLLRRLSEEAEGMSLLSFCRELAGHLIRRYRSGDEPAEVRATFEEELAGALECDPFQAECLVELAIEVLHVKVHGKYRRDPVELSFLIAQTTGVVREVSWN